MKDKQMKPGASFVDIVTTGPRVPAHAAEGAEPDPDLLSFLAVAQARRATITRYAACNNNSWTPLPSSLAVAGDHA